MAHESFEDDDTAALMNERFVNVKVDREERPDLDSLYMDAVVAMTGHGGWPMTVFLLPSGEPFLGGTYFPPEPRHGMPAFRQLLVAVSDAYRERREDVGRQAGALVEALQKAAAATPSADPLTQSLLGEATRALKRQFAPEWGGFGGAPKFPPASVLEFLLRRHVRAADEDALEMVTRTLDGMAAGGMYDVLGGGFHRYSVDQRWLVPHFEKMLYDNALLAPAYLHGWLVTGEERYRDVAEETLDYMLRERRPKPLRDDKAIAAWNGLALAALAEAGRRLDRADFLEAARELAEFLLGPLSDQDGRLHRSWRAGRARNPGYLEDYADVANGLYELHIATGELRWLLEANRLGRVWGDDELERQAAGVLRLIRDTIPRAPSAFGHALSALDLYLSAPRELAVIGAPDDEVARAALTGFDPNSVVAFGPSEEVPLLAGKGFVDARPAVYVCERFACRAPVTEPARLRSGAGERWGGEAAAGSPLREPAATRG